MPALIDLDSPQFTIAEASALAGLAIGTLRDYFQRGVFTLVGKDQSAPAGGIRKLSGRRLMQIAVAAELIEMGVSPPTAARHALAFSDQGNGALPGLADERMPGELYPNSYSWLVIRKGDYLGRVVQVKADLAAVSLIAPRGERAPCIVVPLDPIAHRIFAAVQMKQPPSDNVNLARGVD